MKYYKHFKGKYYELIAEAKDSETLEDVIVYRALYGGRQTWVRPRAMFFENISRPDWSGPRFLPVSEEEALAHADPLPPDCL